MKCMKCGKELVEVGTLTDVEIEDYNYIVNLEITANQALNKETFDVSLFEKEGQVFEYFKSVYSQLAEARFLQEMFTRNLSKRLGVELRDYYVENSKVYNHA